MTAPAPVLAAHRSDDGIHLTVWCAHCQRDHYHGRHSNQTDCLFDGHGPDWPHGHPCTCPTGTGDGHRAAHCHDESSPYYDTGYTLRETQEP